MSELKIDETDLYIQTKSNVEILKKYAPMCKVDGCTNDCAIAWDSYGKIDFHHCHDCHFKYVGKGFYVARIVNGVTGEEQFDFDDDGRRVE
jgi:hypothetical protein|tara:strand:+ start:263 stop:535 length:273 start_codon:yes stop_codon:yes gene_type:complete